MPARVHHRCATHASGFGGGARQTHEMHLFRVCEAVGENIAEKTST